MTSAGISLRQHPYPYRASIAICSDLDETADATTYFNTSEFLNTDAVTPFGRGVDLEVGNTLYFHMPGEALSYFGTNDSDQAQFRALIKSGQIDCLHSFGDDATQRAHASRAIDHLQEHDCQIPVWIDHATAPTNFGSDIMQGIGDLRESIAYHADISFKLGIRFVWLGRVTSFIGQDVPRSILDRMHCKKPPYSLTTVFKSALKDALGAIGYSKYRMHVGNRLTRPVLLRDGTRTVEFIRSNPHPDGVSCGDNAAGIATTLSSEVIDRLVSRRGRMILYTHLGKLMRTGGFPSNSEAALRQLSERHKDGEVLVTTTSRLLQYSQMLKTIQWELVSEGEDSVISVLTDGDFDNIEGLTFEVPEAGRFKIRVNGQFIKVDFEVATHPGRRAIGVSWKKLKYLPNEVR